VSVVDQFEERLTVRLAGSRFAMVEWVSSTGSTNADLMAAAALPEMAGCEKALIADFQEAGRGRRGRTWESAPGSALMLSVLVRPNAGTETGTGIDDAHRWTMAMGLAARDACESVVGVRPRIKWPNDLVFGNAKLAGILAESAIVNGVFDAIVVGIGINILREAGLSDDVQALSTSLQSEAPGTQEVDRVDLAAELLQRFAFWCDAPSEDVRSEHLAQSATVGRRVRVERSGHPSGDVLLGTATDVDEAGRLVVVSEDGTTETLSVGDVTHLRRR